MASNFIKKLDLMPAHEILTTLVSEFLNVTTRSNQAFIAQYFGYGTFEFNKWFRKTESIPLNALDYCVRHSPTFTKNRKKIYLTIIDYHAKMNDLNNMIKHIEHEYTKQELFGLMNEIKSIYFSVYDLRKYPTLRDELSFCEQINIALGAVMRLFIRHSKYGVEIDKISLNEFPVLTRHPANLVFGFLLSFLDQNRTKYPFLARIRKEFVSSLISAIEDPLESKMSIRRADFAMFRLARLGIKDADMTRFEFLVKKRDDPFILASSKMFKIFLKKESDILWVENELRKKTEIGKVIAHYERFHVGDATLDTEGRIQFKAGQVKEAQYMLRNEIDGGLFEYRKTIRQLQSAILIEFPNI